MNPTHDGSISTRVSPFGSSNPCQLEGGGEPPSKAVLITAYLMMEVLWKPGQYKPL
ncbi:hypothetical protein J6590_050964 [Homalodisca vitripennis]|nr:hypothetical protein J6590_050964 [Homalodisca vitripennis]